MPLILTTGNSLHSASRTFPGPDSSSCWLGKGRAARPPGRSSRRSELRPRGGGPGSPSRDTGHVCELFCRYRSPLRREPLTARWHKRGPNGWSQRADDARPHRRTPSILPFPLKVGTRSFEVLPYCAHLCLAK